MQSDLSKVSTDQLIEELTGRGFQRICAGPYCEYQIKRRYSRTTRPEIQCTALIFPACPMKENSSNLDVSRLEKTLVDAMSTVLHHVADDSDSHS